MTEPAHENTTGSNNLPITNFFLSAWLLTIKNMTKSRSN